jgi:threonine/homoserine/homoserine lactone efflux protein
MTLASYLAYCLAATAIIVVPGPTVTVIIANSLKHGARAGLLNVAGTQAGLLLWLAIAIAGLSAAIRAMGVWFDVLRIAGALYLIWLGVKLIRAKGEIFAAAAETPPPKGGFFLQGFIVILSNPKVLLVFGALIPQFIAPDGDFPRQLIFLALTFMALATVFDGAYALLAGKAGAWLRSSKVRVVEIASGLFLIGGGLWLALKGR